MAVFAASAALYGATASRDVQWQDSGMFALRAVEGTLVNPYGLALSHPLHFWLSRLAVRALPLEPAHAVAVVGAAFAAVAVANVFAIVRRLTGNTLAAAVAAAGLGLSNTWWRMATMPECYTVTVALLTVEIWCLLGWFRTRRAGWLMAAFFANGLGLANHNLALLSLPVLGVVALLAVKRSDIGVPTLLRSIGAWVIGSLPYTLLVAREALDGQGVVAAVRSALFGTGFQHAVMNSQFPARIAATSVAFTLFSFPNLTLPFALGGAVAGRADRRTRAITTALLAMLGCHLAFVLRYSVIDQYTFLLPAYAIVAIFAGVGAAAVADRAPPRVRAAVLPLAVATLALTPLAYATLCRVARAAGALGHDLRNKPYRDDYTYLFEPWGLTKHSAARMSREAVALAGSDGTIFIEDPMGEFAIRYEARVRGRPDLQMIVATAATDPGEAIARGGRVVWVPARTDRPPPVLPRGRWERHDALYVFVPQPG